MDTVKARFLAKVRKSRGCWTWTANYLRTGLPYGLFRLGKMRTAHRVSYELFVGEIPDGLFVLHKCDNPKCVKPRHLFLGTQADNNRDASKKGRARTLPRHGEDNPGARFTASQVLAMWNAYASGGVTQQKIAEEYGTDQGTVGGIVRGERWVSVTGGPVSSEIRTAYKRRGSSRR